MTRATQRMQRTGSWGPRQAFTFYAGIAALIRGIAYIWPDGTPSGLQTLAQVPGGLVTWGWAWSIIGVVAIIGATTSRAFPLIPFVGVNILWGGSYLIEWGASVSVRATQSRDYITAVSYLLMAAGTLTIIRLVDPVEVRAKAEGGNE